MIKNFTLNDSTQKEILKQLEITDRLLSKVTTDLSGVKKEATIYAMPDLGIAQNGTRMLGGFYTGACYKWDCDVPFVPVDTTVNVCGTAVYKLKKRISVDEFKKRLDSVMNNRNSYMEYVESKLPNDIAKSIDKTDEKKFYWNYNSGNHFVILAESDSKYSELEEGQYMIVHASAIELKKDNKKFGLYPVEGNWYYNDIKTAYDESGRYLRYISGDTAKKFNELANQLQDINKKRNKFFCEKVLGELLDKEIINLSHYGMPTDNSICIGCQWEQQDFTLLTAPGNDIFLVHPNLDNNNTLQFNEKRITLTPHGCGVKLKEDNQKIKYENNGISIGNKFFKIGESINIGNDVHVRTNGMKTNELINHIDKITNICSGDIYAQLHQLFARTKYGDFNYSVK